MAEWQRQQSREYAAKAIQTAFRRHLGRKGERAAAGKRRKRGLRASSEAVVGGVADRLIEEHIRLRSLPTILLAVFGADAVPQADAQQKRSFFVFEKVREDVVSTLTTTAVRSAVSEWIRDYFSRERRRMTRPLPICAAKPRRRGVAAGDADGEGGDNDEDDASGCAASADVDSPQFLYRQYQKSYGTSLPGGSWRVLAGVAQDVVGAVAKRWIRLAVKESLHSAATEYVASLRAESVVDSLLSELTVGVAREIMREGATSAERDEVTAEEREWQSVSAESPSSGKKKTSGGTTDSSESISAAAVDSRQKEEEAAEEPTADVTGTQRADEADDDGADGSRDESGREGSPPAAVSGSLAESPAAAVASEEGLSHAAASSVRGSPSASSVPKEEEKRPPEASDAAKSVRHDGPQAVSGGASGASGGALPTPQKTLSTSEKYLLHALMLDAAFERALQPTAKLPSGGRS